ncbi:MAG: M14 family metallopeptidase [Acidobacteria bacterium]|nr:M14 family metallopeptidase [Acidobacteriota bacterium]
MRPLSPLPALLMVLALSSSAAPAAVDTAPPAPEEVLGFTVGSDGHLAPYDTVVAYLRQVAVASPRVSVETAGLSTLGREMVVVVVSSADNMRHLDRYREIARRLAHPADLKPEKAAALAAQGKVIVLITGTIHSTEVGSTQMFMELVHNLATTDDAKIEGWLDDVILLIMPSINPDGQEIVLRWYERYRGSEYEGGPLPWLYHPYVGHDNNRDFYMLTQAETRVVNQVLYHRWFPQVFLDEHQMGRTGPRMFVPPQTNPLAPEIDSLIFRQADLLGTIMSMRLEEDGRTGVGHDMIFDSYWPGGTRNTAWWKNVTGLLSEVASARIASPVYIEKGELEGNRKGLPDYGRRSNYPSPWSGGWWRLRDIVEYELTATMALLEGCSRFHESLLANFYELGQRQVKKGRSEAPFAFLIPPDQHDPVAAARLVELLLRHGIEIQQARKEFTVANLSYPAGTTIIPAAQPYRAFLLTMLRPQRYPEVRAGSGGPILPPYDVTSWSLPLSMGVTVDAAGAPVTVATSPLSEPDWPGARLRPGAVGLRISHAAESIYPFMNRLLAAGHPVYWLRDRQENGAPGDVYVPSAGPAEGLLQALVDELHVPAHSLDTAPAGEALQLKPVSIGLYKPWVASIDEGWTRWLLEEYGFPYRNLSNADLRNGSFAEEVDLILLPDIEKDIMQEGRPADPERRRRTAPLPPEYAGGLGDEGGENLRNWILEKGGTVVALDSAADYLIELLDLPVTNILEGVDAASFRCPGAMLRLEVDTDHLLAWGLQPRETAYFASSPAFRTYPPDARFARRVVAAYPDDRRDILISGYLEGAQRLARRAAVVDLQVGAGRVVLIGFRAQHRAQTIRTFKLLFNSLYLPGLKPATF